MRTSVLLGLIVAAACGGAVAYLAHERGLGDWGPTARDSRDGTPTAADATAAAPLTGSSKPDPYENKGQVYNLPFPSVIPDSYLSFPRRREPNFP